MPSAALDILALEPYHGGSHQAFLEGWSTRSRHRWTLLTLPAHKWKWRMRHAAITLAAEAAERLRGRSGRPWDLLFCSDMLNLAEFRGLAPTALAGTPAVAYFHENQLTYPVRVVHERDLHFGMTNLVTALAADAVWFNSAYHRDAFLEALGEFLGRMPDYRLPEAAGEIRRRSEVQPPGVHAAARPPRPPGPLRILWAARWEHDKNPEDFFAALRLVQRRGVEFRVSVIGQQFLEQPAVFEEAREWLAGRIDRWGYQARRLDYQHALLEADVLVCTAHHEFFGISAAEAMAAGAYPLLPRRLAYPELLEGIPAEHRGQFLYDGTPQHLAERLAGLSDRLNAGDPWAGDSELAIRAIHRLRWSERAPALDDAAEQVARRQGLPRFP